MTLEEIVASIQTSFNRDLSQSSSAKEIEELRIKYLGKKGIVQGLMTKLKTAAKDQRPHLGKLINELKENIETQLKKASFCYEREELEKQLVSEALDVTLPGRCRFLGKEHIISKLLNEAIDIFCAMGFSVQYGPDIESDYYNFEALNFHKDHPARDMHDTFYISSETVLRTHTSNTQVRVMESCKPPIRVIAPGKCYRNEDISARSHVLFHQIEGFYIDKEVTFADLLATLEEFFMKFLEKDVKMRYRPSYFPFVEPGMEVDVSCIVCEQKGCNVCKHTGWLEVTGAGMIHPEVMKSGGLDPEEYIGYAWGFGIERLAMMRYGIGDIRLFLENDMRFLQQF